MELDVKDINRPNKTLLLYGDESCHLDHDGAKYMIIGLVCCAQEDKASLVNDIREILSKHKFNRFSEFKWTKISPGNSKVYKDLFAYFIQDHRIFFRGVMAEKSQIKNELLGQSHSEFYGKMYYRAIQYIAVNGYGMYNQYDNYKIFIDISDTIGRSRIDNLRKIFYKMFVNRDLEKGITIQEVRSDEAVLLQLADLICGAIQFLFRSQYRTGKPGKSEISQMLAEQYYLSENQQNIFSNNQKFNILNWRGRAK